MKIFSLLVVSLFFVACAHRDESRVPTSTDSKEKSEKVNKEALKRTQSRL